jgi:hypothetical protein
LIQIKRKNDRAKQWRVEGVGMVPFEIEENIKRFERLLREGQMDSTQREVIKRLLAEEKAKRAKLLRAEKGE